MIAVALKGLRARRMRTVLTALSIVLGVALVSAAYTLTDTMRNGADTLSSASYDKTDAVVSAKTAFKIDSTDWNAQKPTIDAAVLDDVRAVPGVEVAAGDITDQNAKLFDREGELIGDGPYFGVGLDAAQPGIGRVTPFKLTEGRYAAGPREVVIDAATADKKHFDVGDSIRIATTGPGQDFRIVGVAKFGSVKSLGTATVAIFDLKAAQHLFDKDGQYDSILVAGAEGTTAAGIRKAVAAALPATAQVQTAAAHDRFTLEGLKQFVDIIQVVLLVFGAVAVLVGAFTIFNTLSITVAQRTREFGLLRMVGASRRQVLRSVLSEALAIGLGASIVGLLVGFGLAKGLESLFDAIGMDLPQAETVYATRTIVVSLLIGTVVTLIAGLLPAWRATRVAPVAALRDADAAAARPGLFGRAVRGVASALGRPAQAIGGSAGMLARRNAMRTPGRVATTAAALMIGVALFTAVSVLAQGIKDSTSGSLEKRVSASYVLSGADGWSPIGSEVERAAAATPGVTAASSIRLDSAQIRGDVETVNAVDPATIARTYDFDWKQGDQSVLSGLGRDGAVIDDGWATEQGLKVGERFQLTSAAGKTLTLQVRGIEKSPVLDVLGLGPITISRQAFDAADFAAERNMLTLVAGPDSARAALERTLAKYPDAQVETTSAWIKRLSSDVDTLVAIFGVMLALAVIVSLLGLANALILTTFERTRELGMLRAVGMSRRQVRRMIRHESIITALFGAVAGIALGLGLAGIAVAALGDEGLTFGLPVPTLIAFAFVAVGAGVAAAVLPARRAGRLDVLTALAYE